MVPHLWNRGAQLAQLASHQQWRRPPLYPARVLPPAHCAGERTLASWPRGAWGSRLKEEPGDPDTCWIWAIWGFDSCLTEGGGSQGLGPREEAPANPDAWNWREEGLGADQIPESFQLTARTFCSVHGRGASAPSRKAGLACLGFRRGHQQMGDNLGLSSRA